MAFTELRVRDPRMLSWVEIMACHGGGGSKVKHGTSFFLWLHDQLLMIEDYAYVTIDFRGDPYLFVPIDAQ